MKKTNPKNQPVYYVPYARVIVDKIRCPGFDNITKGKEFPIEVDPYSEHINEVGILIADPMFCHHVHVPKDQVELFVKTIVPKYKLGHIVKKIGVKHDTFRIYEYTLLQGKIWYRDGWSVATGCESGVHEDELEHPGQGEVDVSGCVYMDRLVSNSKPDWYKYVMAQPVN
jgi:hypothetical protein